MVSDSRVEKHRHHKHCRRRCRRSVHASPPGHCPGLALHLASSLPTCAVRRLLRLRALLPRQRRARWDVHVLPRRLPRRAGRLARPPRGHLLQPLHVARGGRLRRGVQEGGGGAARVGGERQLARCLVGMGRLEDDSGGLGTRLGRLRGAGFGPGRLRCLTQPTLKRSSLRKQPGPLPPAPSRLHRVVAGNVLEHGQVCARDLVNALHGARRHGVANVGARVPPLALDPGLALGGFDGERVGGEERALQAAHARRLVHHKG
mmetsp:Transcript_15483/g.29800  ORF Transcript_15483/g.29800 Transcript_15483/m.29800 type:complete len:261 (+) Transcript_15483:436-1218(+)